MNPSSSNPAELRALAEEQLTTISQLKLAVDSDDKLLHELQVHQIELEMQNEALRHNQQDLEEMRDRYLDLYEFAPVAYLTLNKYGLIQEINLTGASLLGVKREQLLQRRFVDFIGSVDSDRWHLFFTQQLKKQQRQTLNLTLKNPDQSVFFVQLDCLPLLNQEGLTLRIALTDISELKRSEALLIEARMAAEKASRVKSDFLSSMSHELRTPMNAVLGFAQLLDVDELTDDQHDSVKEILMAGQYLLVLINQVLDLSKIEADKLNIVLEKTDLTSTVQSCIALLLPLTIKKNIRIINHILASSEFWVLVDQFRFKQVLLNLLSNAIKYNQVNGCITLACELINPQTLRINITDTGNGLSESQMCKLFQPFERLSAKNSAIEGTGIGLCIAKKLIEAMNSKIGVNCTEGKGCCFWIEVPLA